MSRKIKLVRVHDESAGPSDKASSCSDAQRKRRRIEAPQTCAAAGGGRHSRMDIDDGGPSRVHHSHARDDGQASGSVVNMLLYPELMSRTELIEHLQQTVTNHCTNSQRQLVPDDSILTMDKELLVRTANEWFVPKPSRRVAARAADAFQCSPSFLIMDSTRSHASPGSRSPSVAAQTLPGARGVRTIRVKKSGVRAPGGGSDAETAKHMRLLTVNGESGSEKSISSHCVEDRTVQMGESRPKFRSPIKFP